MSRLVALGLVALVGLGGCAHTPSPPPLEDGAPVVEVEREGVTPRQEPPSRYGNPASYQVFGRTYQVWSTSHGYRQRGLASWYGPKFHGRRTSSGQVFDMHRVTAAHRHLPLPSYVRVTRLDDGRSLVVRVNDRGPFVDGRIIDLSYAAAKALGIVQAGTAEVEVVAVAPYQALATAVQTSGGPPQAPPPVLGPRIPAMALSPRPAPQEPVFTPIPSEGKVVGN